MASSPSKLGAFLALPLEIRQNIYRLCIPQNLRFHTGWRLERTARFDRWLDCPRIQEEYSTKHDTGGDDDARTAWRVSEGEEREYKPSRLDDYFRPPQEYFSKDMWSHPSALPGILLINRQINHEVEAMLYGGNTFQLLIDTYEQQSFAKRFSPTRRERIRKMILMLEPISDEWKLPKLKLLPEIQLSLLKGISILGIIPKRPVAPTYYVLPQQDPERLFAEWKAWVPKILNDIAQSLPTTAEIIVDVNEEDYMIQIVEKALPGRCRLQRLRTADYIFLRRPFHTIFDYHF